MNGSWLDGERLSIVFEGFCHEIVRIEFLNMEGKRSCGDDLFELKMIENSGMVEKPSGIFVLV